MLLRIIRGNQSTKSPIIIRKNVILQETILNFQKTNINLSNLRARDK